ncbi:MAG: hypothetical protein JNM63_18880 [Spirochaetia bacterium]|nr:hypothetical protein [Spirochaetia bacterium]
MSNLFKNLFFLLSPVFFLGAFWTYALLSTFEESRDIQNELSQSLRSAKSDLEILARRSEILTLPFRSSLGEKPEDTTKILRETAEGQPMMLWLWVASLDGKILYATGGQTQAAPLFKTNASLQRELLTNRDSKWYEVGGKSFLAVESEVRGLFQNAVARIVALADPWKLEPGNRFKSFRVSVSPAGSFVIPVPFPGFRQAFGFEGSGLYYSQEFKAAGRTFFLDEKMSWGSFALVFALFEIVFVFALGIFRSLRENLHSLSSNKVSREDILSNDIAVLVNEEMTPVLRQVQFDLRKLIRKLSMEKETAGVRDLREVHSTEKNKTEAELKQEEEMYARIELPEGKKTALFEDPGVRKEIVYDFELDDKFTELRVDLAALEKEKEEEKAAPGEFEEGKTKLVEDGEAKQIVWDKDLPLTYEEIPYG